MEAEPPKYGETRRPWSRAMQDVLYAAGVKALYSHQALAMDIIRAGRDVVVTTPTASGKTLIYNLPFLERHLSDPEATALYLFPLKALAQDQKKSLEGLTIHWPGEARPTVALYDGDTPDYQRAKIRKNPPNVLITNPEMLHLGILPYHENWTTFLASLSFIVLDEAHIYRGIFGAHMAGVLQRLARVCRRYNANPVHILCTATVGNPGQLGQLLLGSSTPPAVVSESGAPRGRRHMIMMDPLESPSSLVIQLLKGALRRGLRTIVYCRSRRMTELISLWASQKAGEYRDRISAYRAGFLPEERREIEARMASGQLLAVVSTSALELGIDIGSLDVCILVGYPGSIMQTLQRGGRVGRKGQESAVILVGGEDALDQFFIRNPEEFFRRPPENAVLNPDNSVVLSRHVECAASEIPLQKDEEWMRRPSVQNEVRAIQEEGKLLESADGKEWLAARRRPQRDVSLRGSGTTFQIVDTEKNVIGEIDAHRAFRETHEGAVYLHHGRSYVISKLDMGERIAYAVPREVKWHTNVRSSKSTEILSVYTEGRVFNMPVRFGRLRVTDQITGYERRLNGSMQLMDIMPLEMPAQVFETEGLWFVIPDEIRHRVEDNFYHFMGSIHALEHASIGLMPLMVMADRNDFGGISTPMHAQLGMPAVFVYDGLPGGAGLCRSAFPRLAELFAAVRDLLLRCPCELGCPSCVHSPKCGSGNRPIDKAGALFLLERIMEAPAPSGDMAVSGLESEQPKEKTVMAADIQLGGPEAGNIDRIVAPLPERFMVLDVETRRSAAEVGGWHRADLMGVSVAVLYDSKGDCFTEYEQEDLPAMFERLREAGLVIGFNSSRFDYAVLQPFAGYDLRSLPTLDMLVEVKKRLSYRVSLDNLARATLNAPKSADGMQALQWWKEGNLASIAEYCRKDVEITRDVYLFGHREGYLLFTNKAGQQVRVVVEW